MAYDFNRELPPIYPAVFEIVSKAFICLIRDLPRIPPRPYGHINNTDRPDIDGSRIKLFIVVLFRGTIWPGPTTLPRQMSVSFPCEVKAFRATEIGDFQTATTTQDKILRLHITVGDAHFMHVADTPDQFLEEAIFLGRL